jgi:acyl-CoA thioester hydrolase
VSEPGASLPPFRYLLRVRYGECDAQKIVFNARWGEYVDIAATEYTRVLFGSVDTAEAGMDWRVVRQVLEWTAPARFDDVIEARVHTVRVGTTSFTLACELSRWPDGPRCLTVETVYVAVDPASGEKRPVSLRNRARLAAGAPGVVVDHAGTSIAPPAT